MIRLRSRGCLAAAGTLSLVTLAACTPGGEASEDSSELVWAIGGAEAQPGGVNQKIVQRWNEQNPDSTVRIERLPDEADQQREQQALQLQAQDPKFDILGVDTIWTGEYSQNGWIESLDDVREDIQKVTLPGAFESAVWDGTLWAAPFNTNAGFLYYRTDLVDEPPTTWEELCQMATEAGKKTDIGGLIGQGSRYEGFVVNWLELYWGEGGELFNEDQSQVTFDTATAARATEWLEQAQKSGCLAPGYNTAKEEEARNLFQSGKAVFMRNWPYAYGLIKEDKNSPVRDKFDIAPLPSFSDDQYGVSSTGGFNNAVSAYSDNKEAAKEFVVWAATDPEVQRLLATEASVPPTMEQVYEDLEDDPVMSLLGEVLPQAKTRPPAPAWNAISVEMQRALFAAYNGDGDPSEAADSVQQALDEAIQ